MEEHRRTPQSIEIQVELLTLEVAELKRSVEGLVDLWKGARGLLVAVKWMSGLATCVGVIIAVWQKREGG
jgi:hypothetical protein